MYCINVLMYCFNVSKKNEKLDNGVGGCGLINPSFSPIFGFFNLTRPLTNLANTVPFDRKYIGLQSHKFNAHLAFKLYFWHENQKVYKWLET